MKSRHKSSRVANVWALSVVGRSCPSSYVDVCVHSKNAFAGICLQLVKRRSKAFVGITEEQVLSLSVLGVIVGLFLPTLSLSLWWIVLLSSAASWHTIIIETRRSRSWIPRMPVSTVAVVYHKIGKFGSLRWLGARFRINLFCCCVCFDFVSGFYVYPILVFRHAE